MSIVKLPMASSSRVKQEVSHGSLNSYILGVGRVAERPAVYNGEVCKRSLMYLSLTFDHRLVDGAPAARFLGRIREMLERPYLLLT